MNDLIKVEQSENGEPLTSARNIYARLEIAKDFSSWFKQQIDRADLTENQDYILLTQKGEQTGSGGHNKTDYLMPLDIAKHICMMSGGNNAKTLRQEFIEIEKAWNSPEKVMDRALMYSKIALAKAQEKIKALEPKAEFYDTVTDSTDAIDMANCAKILNLRIGRNKLFQFLRDKNILMHNNSPYQQFIDRGFFRLHENTYSLPDGTIKITIKTLVYQKGLDYIRRKYVESEAK